MTRHSFFVSLICFIILKSTSSFVEPGFLFWNKNHRLSFTDFKGVQKSRDSTLTNAGEMISIHKLGAISKSIDVKLVSKSGKTTFTIYAGMNQNDSWIKNNNDSITLNHEQGHFDICEIYARKLRKEIRNVKSLAEANSLYNKISDEENLEQDVYDKENTFQLGGITPKWQDLIRERLKALDAYENPVIVVSIYK